MDAYLDIETTGLNRYDDRITVIGIGLARRRGMEYVQLFEDTLTRGHLREALHGATRLYTYNGDRFDLPFIAEHLGVDLSETLYHRDLMFDCWRKGLYGGLKRVEAQLGIGRNVTDVGGYEAVLLWQRYENFGDRNALDILLEYNREDVGNLHVLRGLLRRYRAE